MSEKDSSKALRELGSMKERRVAKQLQLNGELNKLSISSKEWIDKLQEMQSIAKRISEINCIIRQESV